MNRFLTKSFAAALAISSAALVHASDKSVTVFPAEGNKQCSDYSANGLVLQMGTNSPLSSGSLLGSENPRDADITGESVSYVITGGDTASFSASTTPIDYVILKSGKYISVMIYPAGGVTNDANMKLLVNNLPLTITGISFCYGLGNTPPPPPPLTTIPSCSDLNLNSGGIDGVGITCPGNGSKSIIYNLEVDKPFYNTSNSPMACVCNSPALTECDPGVPTGQPNACPNPLSGSKAPTEVTTHIELNNDPYVCTTVAGVRKCYSY